MNINRLKHLSLLKESRLHWWKHYYVSGLFYEEGLLNIQYAFPKLSKKEEDIYKQYFSYEIKLDKNLLKY